ncbi:Protein vein [Frankliniella fusca]|uniref:Protein vein n=1 Tax=Frankliniella fusca TaxID=407009 RepID=A0AAE1H1L2_9NEOP|nr:Protein vein [Frankliniella fusca]
MALRESKHIISTLYSATRSHFEQATEASVESIIKLWFNKYKDRLYPRAHAKKGNDIPEASKER